MNLWIPQKWAFNKAANRLQHTKSINQWAQKWSPVVCAKSSGPAISQWPCQPWGRGREMKASKLTGWASKPTRKLSNSFLAVEQLWAKRPTLSEEINKHWKQCRLIALKLNQQKLKQFCWGRPVDKSSNKSCKCCPVMTVQAMRHTFSIFRHHQHTFVAKRRLNNSWKKHLTHSNGVKQVYVLAKVSDKRESVLERGAKEAINLSLL